MTTSIRRSRTGKCRARLSPWCRRQGHPAERPWLSRSRETVAGHTQHVICHWPTIGPLGRPTQITEDIILSRDGNHYVGTFTLDAYDTPSNGNKLLAHIIGVITATRITVDTPLHQRILGNGSTRTARPVRFCRVVGRKACHSARTKIEMCRY